MPALNFESIYGPGDDEPTTVIDSPAFRPFTVLNTEKEMKLSEVSETYLITLYFQTKYR